MLEADGQLYVTITTKPLGVAMKEDLPAVSFAIDLANPPTVTILQLMEQALRRLKDHGEH